MLGAPPLGAVDTVAIAKAFRGVFALGQSIAALKLRAEASMTAFIFEAKASALDWRHGASTCRRPIPTAPGPHVAYRQFGREFAAIRAFEVAVRNVGADDLEGGRRKASVLEQFHRLAPCAAGCRSPPLSALWATPAAKATSRPP